MAQTMARRYSRAWWIAVRPVLVLPLPGGYHGGDGVVGGGEAHDDGVLPWWFGEVGERDTGRHGPCHGHGHVILVGLPRCNESRWGCVLGAGDGHGGKFGRDGLEEALLPGWVVVGA